MAEKDNISIVEQQRANSEDEGFATVQIARTERPSLANRVGLVTAILFFTSTSAILFAVGFLAFLFAAPLSNGFLNQIIAKDLFKQCITLLSTVIRFGIGIQVSLCLSMVAALALEKYLVPHPQVAAVSIMRISGASLVSTFRNLLYPITIKGGSFNMQTLILTALTLGNFAIIRPLIRRQILT
jgi:hypothetical protein